MNKSNWVFKLFVLLIAGYLISVAYIVAEHHHDDGKEHHNCPICKHAVMAFTIVTVAGIVVFLLIAYSYHQQCASLCPRKTPSVFFNKSPPRLS